jgi:hypothetical protein
LQGLKKSKLQMLKLFTLSAVGAAGVVLQAQIVNIEARRIVTDTTGINGHTDLNFMANQSKYRFISLGVEAQVQYKTKKSLFLLLGNVNYTQAQTTDYLNDGFAHFRYNYKIADRIKWEFFAQYQYNHLLALNERKLLGMGPRFKFIDAARAKAYLGTLLMYEHEILNTAEAKQSNVRASTYLSWTIANDKKISFTGTTYYQPLLRNFSDYRLSGQYNLLMHINAKMYFKNTLNFMYDSRPALGTVKTVYSFMAGLGFLFK